MSLSSLRAAGSARPYLLPLLALQLFFTLYTPKGHFTDSFLYYWETESVVELGQFALENGYEETPSPALVLEGMVVHDGRLYSPYPALYSLAAAPFLAVFGEAGLFYMNSLALVGALLLTLALARRVAPGSNVSGLSVTILLGGTFFWYYSQAIWPHMLQTCLILAAALGAVIARERDGSSPWPMVVAGLALGVGVGVRLDTIFVVPAVAALALAGRAAPRKLVGLTIGLAPPLALLSVINGFKFGQPIPFSYGVPFGASEKIVVSSDYLAVLVPVLLVCALYVVRSRGSALTASRRGRTWITYAVAAGAVLALVNVGLPLLRGVGILLVDMRFLEPGHLETGMLRVPGGAVIYGGHFKKALLPSAPFLPLVILPLLRDRDDDSVRDRDLFSWLYLIPVSYLILFCGLRWHGGMAYDMRYFVPTLPFFAILAAIVVATLTRDLSLRSIIYRPSGLLVVLLLALLFVASVAQAELPLEYRRLILLEAPLGIGAVTLVVVGVRWFTESTLSSWATGLLCLPLFWGGSVAMSDYARQAARRGANEQIASRFAPDLPEGSLVLGYQRDLLSKTRDVRFTSRREEVIPELPALVERQLQMGNRTFLLGGTSEAPLREVGLPADDYRLRFLAPLWIEQGPEGGGLYELVPRSPNIPP